MKKLWVLWVVLALSLLSAGCDDDREKNLTEMNALKDAIEGLENTDSYTLVYQSKEETFTGGFNITEMVDGDTRYLLNVMMDIDFETYIVVEEDTLFAYTRNSEEDPWLRSQYNTENYQWLQDMAFEFTTINLDWFEYEADRYSLKEAYYEDVFDDGADEIKSFTIQLDSNRIAFNIEATEESQVSYIDIIFKDIGITVIEIPDFGNYQDVDDSGDDFNPNLDLPEVEPFASGELSLGAEDAHPLEIDTPGVYLIWSESDLRLTGEIYDDHFMAGATGLGPGQNFLLEIYLEIGTYELLVLDWEGIYEGPYTLHLHLKDDD